MYDVVLTQYMQTMDVHYKIYLSGMMHIDG